MITKMQVLEVLNGNWDNSQIGELEEQRSAINCLKDALATTMMILINEEIIDITDYKDKLEEGWKLTYEK